MPSQIIMTLSSLTRLKKNALKFAKRPRNNSFLGIIIMYNCLDAYELESILTHIESSIPSSKSVLIVANFSDLDEYNTIDAQIERVRNASDQRETPIYFCKSSMATGRGLSMIYKFINIPYLRIK